MTAISEISLKALLPKLALSGLQKVIATIFGLITVFLLAVVLGPDGFGRYSFVFSLATVAAVPLSLGLPSLVVREVARAKHCNNWKKFNGVQYFAFLVTITGSLVIIPSILIATNLLEIHGETRLLLIVALSSMPFLALSSIRAAVMTGLGMVVRGQIPDSIVRPMTLIVLILLSNYFMTLTPLVALLLYFFAVLLSFFVGLRILSKSTALLPKELGREIEYRNWLRSLVPLSLVAGLQVVNSQIDILVLGLFEPYESVGVYRVAASAAGQVIFITFVMNQVLAPYFVQLHDQRRVRELRELARKAGMLCFLVALSVVFFYWAFGEYFIQYLLGSEYADSYDVLRILSCGYLLYALSSSANTLLTMTGNEKYLALSAVLAVVVNTLLNFILIPNHGVIGAAIATVCAMGVWRLILLLVINYRLQIFKKSC